jgi:hypothetical protein
VFNEREAKYLARAIELFHTTHNAWTVETILSLETGRNGVALIGYIRIAEHIFFKTADVAMDRWVSSEPTTTSIPL